MSYEPTQWKAGDTVTSAKLNKMEQGIANIVKIINTSVDDDNKVIFYITPNELQEALNNDQIVLAKLEKNDVVMGLIIISTLGLEDGIYQVATSMGTPIYALDPDDYLSTERPSINS